MGRCRLPRLFQCRVAVPHRMAGKSRGSTAHAGHNDCAERRRQWTHRNAERRHGERQTLFRAAGLLKQHHDRAALTAGSLRSRSFRALVFGVLLLAPALTQAATQITSARVWPAQDYTRITLESAAPIQHQMLLLK